MDLTTFSDADLYAICLGAESVKERSELSSGVVDYVNGDSLVDFRRERWCAAATAGNPELFATLLDSQGLEAVSCGQYLRPRRSASVATGTFSWFPRLRKTVTQMQYSKRSETRPLGASEKYPLPFEEIFFPVIEHVDEERDSRLRLLGIDVMHLVSDPARDSMRRALLIRLCGLAAEIFYRQFHFFRASSEPEIETRTGDRRDSRKVYLNFIGSYREQLLRESFLTFPVLARLLCLAIDQWIDTTAEMLFRVHADLPLLESQFSIRPTRRIEHLVSLGSDPHRGGRSAWSLTISGRKIVYKPRSLAIDVAWMKCLKWLELNGAPPSAGRLAVCNAGDYGWMEWVEHSPWRETGESFFRRFGALLCLAHLFNANDLHYENVVVSGTVPHIVDIETLFHPRSGLLADEERFERHERSARNSLRDTVAWTALLPTWLTTHDLDIFPIGALNPRERARRTENRFIDLNTDAMRLARVEIEEPQTKSLPQGLVGAAWARSGARLICEGFENMWDFIVNHRTEIVGKAGPLEQFRNVNVRVLLKSTQVYFFSIKRSLGAEFLVDGGVWYSQQQLLFRTLGSSEEFRKWTDILAAEQRAHSRLDIPYFSVRCDDTTLYSDGEVVLANAFDSSPLDSVRNRIQNMSPKILEVQKYLITQSILALEAPDFIPDSRLELRIGVPSKISDGNFERDMCDEANRIGNNLVHASIEQNGKYWLALAPLRRSQNRQIAIAGLDLYSGNCGIALFFSALAFSTKDEKWVHVTRTALSPLTELLRNAESTRRLARSIGVGAGSGMGGLVYSLVRIGKFLGAKDLLEIALQACKDITQYLVECDQDVDALNGIAGGILALVTVAMETGEGWPLELALACGDRLIELAEERKSEEHYWRDRDGEIQVGMAHGGAGIALALYRLGEASGQSKYTMMALSALEFETETEGYGNYTRFVSNNLDRHTRNALACRWCRGTAGLGLTFLCCGSMKKCNDIRAMAVKTSGNLFATEDNLCCGNFGRTEFVLSAGLKLCDRGLQDVVRSSTSKLVQRSRAFGNFASRVHDDVNPGFFSGISGIGYELLRIADPTSFPSILCWE